MGKNTVWLKDDQTRLFAAFQHLPTFYSIIQRSLFITVVYLVWYIYILDTLVNQVAECTWKPRLNSLFSFEGQLCTLRRVLSLLDRYFYKMYIVNMFKIVFAFNGKDTSIFQCLHNIRLSYSIYKCFSTLSECACVHLRIEWRPVCDHAIWTRFGDAGALHGKFTIVNNRVHIAWTQTGSCKMSRILFCTELHGRK